MKTITTTKLYYCILRWKKLHLDRHGCSEQEATEWAYWNATNPPGPAGSACEELKVVNG